MQYSKRESKNKKRNYREGVLIEDISVAERKQILRALSERQSRHLAESRECGQLAK